jgi:hypothetical protein
MELPFPVTHDDKIKCLRRELSLRRQVYPRRVHDGKMKSTSADREIRVMEAILSDYENGQ